jgi:diguanylate cyclase (GGDEF)-like protein
MEAMRRHMNGEAPVYEVEYRIKTKSGEWKWFKDRGKVTQRDEKGKPLFAAGIVFDITEEKKKEEQLEKSNVVLKEEAMTDELTGLMNRRAFTEMLQKQFRNTSESSKRLSVGMFDPDRFKNINDKKGHVFGDKVLKETASIIKESLRNMDFAGRYGGEEFIVVFPDTKKEDAYYAAERIRQAVEAHDFGEGVRVTISGGIAETPSPNIKELIHRADTNLYRAKQTVRNRIVI